jgi:chromosome segregation ATPase
MEELVALLNKELDSSHRLLATRMDTIDSELNNVRQRLTRLYDALETGKLSLDDLSPRIKEQRSREADLNKMRLQIEAEMLTQGPTYVDAKIIKEHARDLKAIFEETDLARSKAFLRSFIKRVTIDGTQARIQYTLPIPPDEKSKETVSVLPIETPSGDRVTIGRTFELTFSLSI